MAAEARRNSPTSSRARDDVEDGRFGDDDFDAEGADDVGVFDAVGFPETADEGAFRMGVEDPDADFGDWAHPEELGVGGDGAVAMRGGLPLDDMDDSIIKDYAVPCSLLPSLARAQAHDAPGICSSPGLKTAAFLRTCRRRLRAVNFRPRRPAHHPRPWATTGRKSRDCRKGSPQRSPVAHALLPGPPLSVD